MDNLDQRRTHTPGHESHGNHVCYKCAWSFPNPHPSAKQRRAHKKICGTIEGYKSHFNGSDDEHASDDDHKTPGLVVSGPITLDTGKIEKGNDGIGKKLVRLRSEDEVFSDAAADFSDNGPKPGIKEPLQEDNLDSSTSVEKVDIKDPIFSGPPKNSDFINDVSELIDKSSDDYRIQNPKILQTERVDAENTLELQGQLSGSIVHPLPSSVADLRTEESTVLHGDDFFGLSIDSHPSKTQVLPDVFPENKSYAGENVTDCSLISVAQETKLIGKDEMESDRDMVEIVDSSDKVVSETHEGVSDIAVSGPISLDHQVADEAVNLKEKNDAEFLSVLAQDNLPLELNSVVISNSSTNNVQVESAHVIQFATCSDVNMLQEKGEGNVNGETCEGVSDTAIGGAISMDHQVADEAVNLKENNGAEFLSVLPQNDLPPESNSVVITKASTNDVQVEVERVIPFATSSDVKILQEKGEGNVNGETCEGVSYTAISGAISVDHQVADEAVNLKEKNGAEFLCVLPQNDLPPESNSVVITKVSTNDVQVEFERVIPFATSSDVKILQEKGEGNVNADTLPACDDRPDVAHLQSDYEDCKDQEGVVSQNPISLHSSESLKHEEEDLKNSVTEEINFGSNPSQLTEKSDVLCPDMHVVSSTSDMNKELVNFEPMAEEIHAEEEHGEVTPVKLIESFDRLDEIGGSMNTMKTEMNESHTLNFSEEHGIVDVCKDSQQISLPEGSLMTSPNGNPTDASFGSATSEITGIISIDNASGHEKNRTEINNVSMDGNGVRANVENDIGTKTKDLQPSDLLQLEAKQSSDLIKSDDAGEMGKIEKCDITDAQCMERSIVRDTSLSISADSHIESPVISEVVSDGTARMSKGIECTDIGPISAAQEDIKEDEINSNIEVHEEYNRSLDPSTGSHHTQDAELLGKAAENLTGKYSSFSSLNTEPSAQHDSGVENNQDGDPGREVSGLAAVHVQDQSVNNLVKHSSTGTDASVDSGSRCDSLEGNWGSVSVISLQSDAPAVIDTETLPSNGSLASTEAGKSNMNNPKDASGRQQSGKSEMFEPPSFMTLVEAGHVISPKAAAYEIQKGPNPQQPSSTLQAGWFPTLTQVINDSQGRKKNKEIIAKVTNWSTGKEHTPLKSLLGEAALRDKPKSPKLEERSVNQNNGKIPENSISELTTVNSILGPESPSAQAAKGEAAKEWNSPARYPADMKREKRKVKSRPFWIQLVCCSSVDPQRR